MCFTQYYYENFPKDSMTSALRGCKRSYGGGCSYRRNCCKSGSGAIISRQVGRRSYRFTYFACGSSANDAAVVGLRRCGSKTRCRIGDRWGYKLGSGGNASAGSGSGSGQGDKKKPGAGGSGDDDPNNKKKTDNPPKRPKPTVEFRESIAFCWRDKNKPNAKLTDNAWHCHGPGQKIEAYTHPFGRMLRLSGCAKVKWRSRLHVFTSGDKRGYVVICSQLQRSYSQKVGSKYGVPARLMNLRRTYLCSQYGNRTVKACKRK